MKLEVARRRYPEACRILREQGAAAARAELAPQHEADIRAAVTAERERVLGIQALHAPGLEALRAELVGDPTVTVQAAAARILTAQAERTRARGQKFLTGRRMDEGRPGPEPSTGADVSDRAEKIRAILTAGKPVHPNTRSSQ